ncbi:large conductance mechanosensitive channel protein MscL [Cohnella sp. F6_2S_P_1]|uniref:Large-conductance mechanosensitive channel n=2 Tax=Cohnella hashimotonis TaxID=2826895 RepID=A0ABT6TNU6_9BACL|nr:large conductance mechanosensitive channel protein MscL [Cohnella hashimotonis]MDI4648506.1 large conductance mechanosensitive channel protein MscL [Cohnella hashimotonis]
MAGEFKTFAMRGNVIDLAVGVIIGGAFGQIVTSLVNDIVMPPIGRLLGGVDFKDLYWRIGDYKEGTVVSSIKSLEDARAAGAPVIAYGQFINIIINFLIIAFCVFMLVKVINKLTEGRKKDEPLAEPSSKECPYCLSVVPIKAVRCAHCTSELEATARA